MRKKSFVLLPLALVIFASFEWESGSARSFRGAALSEAEDVAVIPRKARRAKKKKQEKNSSEARGKIQNEKP